MAVSFVYLAFVSLLKLLTGRGSRVDVTDVGLLVVRHQLGDGPRCSRRARDEFALRPTYHPTVG